MVDTEQIMQTALRLSGLQQITEDSGIWVPGRNLRRALFGMDITTAELLLARQQGFDLVIAHHPPEATLQAWRVYMRHVELMEAAGVPREEAEAMVTEEVEGMQWRAQARNYDHTVSVARFLDLPFMNIHGPLDEIGRQRVESSIAGLLTDNPKATVSDVVATLERFGEVVNSQQRVRIACGNASDPAGKVVFAHGALDIPNYSMLAAYFAHGVNTVITIRASAAEAKRLQREKVGAWVSIGHNAGDSLGFTPFLNALAEMGLEVTTISGVIPPSNSEF